MRSYTKARHLRWLLGQKVMEYLLQPVEVGSVASDSIPTFQQYLVAEEQKLFIFIVRMVLINLNFHDSHFLRRISGFRKAISWFNVP